MIKWESSDSESGKCNDCNWEQDRLRELEEEDAREKKQIQDLHLENEKIKRQTADLEALMASRANDEIRDDDSLADESDIELEEPGKIMVDQFTETEENSATRTESQHISTDSRQLSSVTELPSSQATKPYLTRGMSEMTTDPPMDDNLGDNVEQEFTDIQDALLGFVQYIGDTVARQTSKVRVFSIPVGIRVRVRVIFFDTVNQKEINHNSLQKEKMQLIAFY